MPPGVVVLWSGTHPRLDAYAVPPRTSLPLNRSTVAPDDDQVSLTHAVIDNQGRQLQVFDLDSRNGTYLDGVRLNPVIGADNSGLVGPGTLIRIGCTLLITVADIQPYLDRSLTTRHRLPVWVSLHRPCDELDQAILDESSVAIVGPRWVGRALGRSYVTALGGGPEIDASQASDSLETRLGGAMPRVAMLCAPGALLQPDLRTLRTWLETDVRFVTVARRERELDALPREIVRWLVPKRIVIPEPRYDELPTVIHSSVIAAAPGMEIHKSAIEDVLLEAPRRGEDELLRRVGDRVRDLLARRVNVLRGNLFHPEAIPTRDEPTYVQFRSPSYPIDDE